MAGIKDEAKRKDLEEERRKVEIEKWKEERKRRMGGRKDKWGRGGGEKTRGGKISVGGRREEQVSGLRLILLPPARQFSEESKSHVDAVP